MKYKLEIQHEGFNVNTDEIVKMVKDSLKAHKIPVSKVADLRIYYVVDTKIVYYTGEFNRQTVSSNIYLV